MTTAKKIGEFAENIAGEYLQTKGLSLLARNFHSRYGEIDLIMLDQQPDGQYLCFIEVKARRINSYVRASESIIYSKQNKIIQTAQIYLQKYPEYENLFCRFDAFTLEYQTLNFLSWQLSEIMQDPSIQLQWIPHAYTL